MAGTKSFQERFDEWLFMNNEDRAKHNPFIEHFEQIAENLPHVNNIKL